MKRKIAAIVLSAMCVCSAALPAYFGASHEFKNDRYEKQDSKLSLNEVQEKISFMKGQKSALENRLQDLNTRYAALGEEMESLNSQAAEKDQALKALQTELELASLKTEGQDLSGRDPSQIVEEMSALQEEKETLEAAIRECSQTQGEVKALVTVTTESIEKYASRINEDEAQAAVLIAEINEDSGETLYSAAETEAAEAAEAVGDASESEAQDQDNDQDNGEEALIPEAFVPDTVVPESFVPETIMQESSVSEESDPDYSEAALLADGSYDEASDESYEEEVYEEVYEDQEEDSEYWYDEDESYEDESYEDLGEYYEASYEEYEDFYEEDEEFYEDDEDSYDEDEESYEDYEDIYEDPVEFYEEDEDSEEYYEDSYEDYEDSYEDDEDSYEDDEDSYEDDEESYEEIEESYEEDEDSYEEEEDDYVDSSSATYLGTFTLTAYCDCAICCGTAGNMTASGTWPSAGTTVAMGGVPFGTQLLINGHVYTVEDRGTPYGHVDIFFDSHEEALQFGLQSAEVYQLN